jgi:SAM-dependent methyltransferase
MDHDPEDLTPVEGIARCRAAECMAQALRHGTPPSDRAFDRFLSRDLQRLSRQHWTPLVVAIRVGEWLDRVSARTVVDIGSGSGKFCVAAALVSRAKFTGIEQRPRLVDAARRLARAFGVEDRVTFLHATARPEVIPVADAYYLYNPFGENLQGHAGHVDSDVELSAKRYRREVALMERFFHGTRVGTYVVKYNGFGGVMPAAYAPIRIDHDLSSILRMWQMTATAAPDHD